MSESALEFKERITRQMAETAATAFDTGYRAGMTNAVFAKEDVVMLRAAVAVLRDVGDEASMDEYVLCLKLPSPIRFANLADRIEALLPPEPL